MAAARRIVPTANKWLAGDRVAVDFDGVEYLGDIMSLKGKTAIVSFDDGDTQEIDLSRLVKSNKPKPDEYGDEAGEATVQDDDITFEPPAKGARGMHIYPVTWDKAGLNFRVYAAPDQDDLAISARGDAMIERLQGRMVMFYGYWRKTNFIRVDDNGKVLNDRVHGYSIDMYARVQGETKNEEYLVESLRYEDSPETGDPRKDMHSLNSDICVAIRKWFFVELKGDRETLKQLRKRADFPTIKAPSLQWLDTLILKIKEVRDTALRSGGERFLVMQTDNANDPVMAIRMDFTAMAIAMEGKVPNLYAGTMHEQAQATGGKKSGPKPQMLQVKIDPENLTALAAKVKELNALAKQGDMAAKSEARKIRAALRQHGHRGGARATEA